MPPDIGFVSYPPERYANESSSHRARDGFSERRLADARRPDKAKDRALARRIQLAHGQEFENAFLDLAQVIVVRVQDTLGLVDIELVLCLDGPGQLANPVEISADDAVFRRGGGYLAQSVQLAERLLFHLLRHLGCRDVLADLLELFASNVLLAELGLNGFQLLLQEILALALVDGFSDAALDFMTELKDLHARIAWRCQVLQAIAAFFRYRG